MSRLMASSVADIIDLLEDDAPVIAVSFGDRVSDAEIARAQKAGLDVAELRIDRYKSFNVDYVLEQVNRFTGFPTIATIRIAAEGGEWTGTEAERLQLFTSVLPHVQAVDIELDAMDVLPALVEQARALRKLVIVSHHNYEYTSTAADLEQMAARAKELGADYVKLSAHAHTPEDVQTLATFTLKNAGLGLIVVAMGQYGPVTRVFFPMLGSRLTYASISDRSEVYGQLPFSETFDLLRRLYPQFNDKKINELRLLDGA